uniref:Putative F-box/kelch-repeat protein n=1 Tax=Noccaea caerulescens TaxID=107243 RepID=A0A1J3E9I5_NOCCA
MIIISTQIRKKKMRKWLDLPPKILHSISRQIDNPFDLIHFRSVCSSWQSSSLLKFRHMTSLRCPLPLDSGGRSRIATS